MGYKIIGVKGSAYEIGAKTGEELRELIKENIESIVYPRSHRYDFEMLRKFEGVLKAYLPDRFLIVNWFK